MPAGDKFRDEAVKQTLYQDYEELQANNVSQMLDQSETNSRVNQEMARWCLIARMVEGNWKGSWSHFFGSMVADMQRLNLNMDGYSRVQAIDMCAAHTTTEQALANSGKEKRGGLLGLLGR
jgi:hypothetical protein